MVFRLLFKIAFFLHGFGIIWGHNTNYSAISVLCPRNISGGAKKSLLIALEKEPDNPETLLTLARIESHFTESDEGRDYYLRGISALAKQQSPELTSVFSEFFLRYRELVEPELQFRIAGNIYKEGNLDMAERVLSMLANSKDAPPTIKEQSLLLAGRILEKMELNEAAEWNYRRFMELYPESQRIDIARERLALLTDGVHPA